MLPEVIRKRLESPFDRNGSLGFPLGLVRKIEIFEFALAVAGHDPGLQIVAKLSLLLDCIQDRGAARFQVGVVLPPALDIPDLDLVKIARSFLTVSSDERNSSSVVE